jgi:hypothetical protein
MKIRYALVSTLFFLAILFLIYYIHVTYLRVNIVFYASITDAMIAASLAGLILFTSSRFRLFNHFEKLQLLFIWVLVGYGLAISVPTVIDRSLSFYILEKLEQRGGGIKLNAFEEVFTKEYVKEHRLVDVRLTEQLESGTITINGECVKLTDKGRGLVKFSTMFRHNMLPKKRLLMGHYSDDLTDPLRKSDKNFVNYICN